jgi:PE-PPE domain
MSDRRLRRKELRGAEMPGNGLRRLGFGVLSTVGAGLLGLPSTIHAAVAYGDDTTFVIGGSSDVADSPLGDGTAFIMGPTGFPTPNQGYLNAVDALYLEPRGFGGTTQALTTPEQFNPVTGLDSLTADQSVAQGQQILVSAIENQIASGQADTANPAVIFGYSQSSVVSSMAMQQLAEQGVPSGDVHFVLVGDSSNPNGGLLERFDVPAGTSPSFPDLGTTFSGATPDNLYPTDIYTLEYDGFADFPQYPIDPFADLNAVAGVAWEHDAYLSLDPDQLQNAVLLPGSAALTGEGMTNYYMVPVDNLPMLDTFRLIPVVGNPLADLLQPDLKVLVDLGYGSVTDGWSQGAADVPTTFGLFPSLSVLEQVPAALVQGTQQGITDAIDDLLNPQNYEVNPNILANPVLTPLEEQAYVFGLINTPDPTLAELLAQLPPAVSPGPEVLQPVIDTVNAALTELPAYDYNIFVDQLEAGNLLGAIGDPIAADMALIPYALTLGVLTPALDVLLPLLPGLF